MRLRRTRGHRSRRGPVVLRRSARAGGDRRGRRRHLPARRSRSTSTTAWCCAGARSPRAPGSPTASVGDRGRPGRGVLPGAGRAGWSACRPARPGASARPSASRTRWASRSSSSSPPSTSTASPSATTCTARRRSAGWTTSTSSPPTSPRRSDYYEGLGFRVSEDIEDAERHRLRDLAAPQGDRARRRPDRRRRAAPAPHRLRHPRAQPDPAPLRPPRRARAARTDRARPRPARRVQRLLPLPARSRRAPHRDLHPRLLHRRPRQPGRTAGTSTTTSAATGGATPSSRPGTPRPPRCSTWTGGRGR